MSATAPADQALRLPWLAPSAASLVALTRHGVVAVGPQIGGDPGCLLLLARHLPSCPDSPRVPAYPLVWNEAVRAAALGDALRALSARRGGFADWGRSPAKPIYEAAWAHARLARHLAERIEFDPEAAWCAGLLAPLGWLAVGATAPEAAEACRAALAAGESADAAQRRLWGVSHDALTRRLTRRWQLPAWLALPLGHLALPAEIAAAVGADVRLVRLLQVTAGLLDRSGEGLCLAGPIDPKAPAAELGLTDPQLTAAVASWRGYPVPPAVWVDPLRTPLLVELLTLAVENDRLRAPSDLPSAEHEIDGLQEALRMHLKGTDERLHRAKLAALAELAAGAGHEINNPLAVISGQGQYLLAREEDPGRRKALETIVRQTKRIHQVLTDLMQFARPPKPRPQEIDLRALIGRALDAVQDSADERGVRLEGPPPGPAVPLTGDPNQVQTALTCLLRNGVEAAAPPDAWVRLRLEERAVGTVVVIEDNGPGPSAGQVEHLFDPFYSGRQAGRGRGLGLPTAWRLIREHGGDVTYEPTPGGPTRFVLSLPLPPARRQSA